MELTYALFIGALSGLVSALAHVSLWSSLARAFPERTAPWLTDTGQNPLGILLHSLAGIGVGFMYWMSWGYAGLVTAPWWWRGIIFGVTIWGALSLSVLLTQWAAGELRWRRVVVNGTQWMTTCVLTAVTCAWSWAKVV